jgi:hypothetical protein
MSPSDEFGSTSGCNEPARYLIEDAFKKLIYLFCLIPPVLKGAGGFFTEEIYEKTWVSIDCSDVGSWRLYLGRQYKYESKHVE